MHAVSTIFVIITSSSLYLFNEIQQIRDASKCTLKSKSTDSDQPTQRRASSDVQITVSATGVLRLLDHVCGTCCQSIYGCVTVLNSLNGCRRPICLVFRTVALCDALVRSAVYKSSYLLTLDKTY